MSTAIRFDAHYGSRRQFAHALEDGEGRGHNRVKGHVVVQGDRIDVGIQITRGDQCREKGRETQRTGCLSKI